MIKSVSDQNVTASGSVPKTATALMYSCQQGDYHRTHTILKKYPDAVYNRDNTNKNALHYCSECKDVQCADLILTSAPELIDTTDEDGFTPLHLAAITGNLKLVTFLLGNKANINAVDHENHSVVHWAIVSKTNMVTKKVNKLICPQSCKTCLFNSLYSNKLVCKETDVLRTILAAGAPVSTPDIHGGYPLHYASQMCGMEEDSDTGLQILNILLTHPGIDINVKDRDGRSPILWAASSGSARAVLSLFKAGIPTDTADTEGLTALHCAASRGHTDCLDTLISLCGAKVNLTDNNECTPLHYAVTLGHADATALLLMHGADCEKVDKKGRTAAHCGCAKGQIETIKLLKNHGANLWVKNQYGDLPLHNAVASDRIELVKWLLSLNQFFVNAQNDNGRTPLHIAALKDNINMCKVLLDYGADINAIYKTAKNTRMTPFDCAAYHGYRGTAKFLQLHNGVPVNKIDSVTENGQHNPENGLKVSKKITKHELNKNKNTIDLTSSDNEFEYEYMQGMKKERNQRKSKSNCFLKKSQTHHQLKNVNNKKKRVQKYFNEPILIHDITDTEKNDIEYVDEDPLRKSQEKNIDLTPESILTEMEKNFTPEDLTVIQVEEVHNFDINKEELPQGNIPQDALNQCRKESFEIISPEVNVDDIFKIENQAEIPTEEIVPEVDNIDIKIEENNEQLDVTKKEENPPEVEIEKPIEVKDGEINEMFKEIFDNENNERLEESLKNIESEVQVDNTLPVTDEVTEVVEKIDSNNNDIPDKLEDLTKIDPEADSLKDIKSKTSKNGELVRRKRKLKPHNVPISKIGIERSVEIESNVPFVITENNEHITNSLKPKKKIEIDSEKITEASSRKNSDPKRGQERYESFSILNNKVADPSFQIIPATPSNNSEIPSIEKVDNVIVTEAFPEIITGTNNPKKDSVSKSVNKTEASHVLPCISPTEKGSFTVLNLNTFSDIDEKVSSTGIPEGLKKRSKSLHRFHNFDDNDSSIQLPLLKSNNASVTQKVQSNIRTYYVERKIFNELLELKRLQIRSGQANEAALTKRLVDSYNKSSMATVGLGPFKSKDYSYKNFEKFLYDTLRKLNSDNESFSEFSSSHSSLECTKTKYRCPHAAHAYSEIPCLGNANKNCEKKKFITMEICNGTEKKVISLPAEKFDPNKRYFVTFSVKEKSRTNTADEKESVKNDCLEDDKNN